MAVRLEKNNFHIFETAKNMVEAAAKDFYEKSIAAVQAKGDFTVVLSGGNTPKSFFDVLADTEEYKNNIPWDKIRFFFGDERYVPSTDERSNFYSAQQHLFSKVSVNQKNIFKIPTDEQDPRIAAEKYEQIIRKEMNLKGHECPKFDVCYLGLGDNAHTASLWPHSEIVMRYAHNHLKDESTQLVTDLYVQDVNMHRITLTPNAINCSAQIIFMVTGADKACAVSEVVEGELDPVIYPAQLIQRVHTPTLWYLDEASSAKIKRLL